MKQDYCRCEVTSAVVTCIRPAQDDVINIPLLQWAVISSAVISYPCSNK